MRSYSIMVARGREPRPTEWSTIASTASRAVAHTVLSALRAADVPTKLVSSPPRIGSSGRAMVARAIQSLLVVAALVGVAVYPAPLLLYHVV